jgi:hypothetical protein
MGLSATTSQAVQKEQVKPMMAKPMNDNDADDKGFMKLRFQKGSKKGSKDTKQPPKQMPPMKGRM